MILRYKECWIILLGNNIIDLVIWIINFIEKEYNSKIMLIVSIFMLLFNILGIIKWDNNKKEDYFKSIKKTTESLMSCIYFIYLI